MKKIERKPVYVFECTSGENTMAVSRSSVEFIFGNTKENGEDEIAICIEGPHDDDTRPKEDGKTEVKALLHLTREEAENLISALTDLIKYK